MHRWRDSLSRACWIAACTLVLGVCTFALFFSPPVKNAPSPRAGQADFSHWDFQGHGSAPLSGKWLFYDGRWANGIEGRHGALATVPGPWPANPGDSSAHVDGFGTYELTIKLPAASRPLAVDTGQIYSAYRLYADGRVIAEGGAPAATAPVEVAHSYSTLANLPAGARVVRLRLETSNHLNNYGGFFTAPVLGFADVLERQRHLTEMLALIVVGVLFFTACHHFVFGRSEHGGRAHLWFGGLAALLVLRNFLLEPLASSVLPLLGQDWVWRIDFAVTSLSVPAGYWFLALSFPRYLSRRFGWGLGVLCGVCALACLLDTPTAGESIFKFVEIIACTSIIYLTYSIARSVLDGEVGARLALAGWGAVSIAVVHDILIDNQVISGGNALPIGCVLFFLCFSGAVTARTRAAFEAVSSRSLELSNLNTKLEAAVGARTTELKQKIIELEEQHAELERSREAAVSASETKSRFLANMSHELRTPMNAIVGFSEIMASNLFRDLPERYVGYAGDIHASGRHLLALINDILDLSKIEAGRSELNEECLDVNAEIAAAIRLVEPRALAKSLRVEFAPGAPLEVMADRRALHQILVNLLTNAAKFTRSGGEIEIAARRSDDGATEIVIRDTGVGIGPEDMERVLESFGQGRHDVTPDDERGTGLGLPIVKGLVEAHGGTFALESRIGVGTRAVVSLPPDRAVRKAA